VATIAFQFSGSNSTSSSGTTLTTTVAAGGYPGDGCIVFVSCSIAGDVVSIEDNVGTLYELATSQTNGLYNLYAFVGPSIANNGPGDIAVTATFSTTGLTACLLVGEYSSTAGPGSNPGATGWMVPAVSNEAVGGANPSLTLATTAAETMIAAGAIGDAVSAPTAGTSLTSRQAGTDVALAFILEDWATPLSGSNVVGATGAGATTSTLVALGLAIPSIPYAVQGWLNDSGGSDTVTNAYADPQTAGNVNLLLVGWQDATSTCSVEDTSGNVYASLGLIQGNGCSVQFFVCEAIEAASGGANTVTATLTGTPSNFELCIIELVPCVVDVPTVNFATDATSSASVTSGLTSSANTLFFSYFYSEGSALGLSTGWTGYTPNGYTPPFGNGAVIEYQYVAGVASTSIAAISVASATGWVQGIVGLTFTTGFPAEETGTFLRISGRRRMAVPMVSEVMAFSFVEEPSFPSSRPLRQRGSAAFSPEDFAGSLPFESSASWTLRPFRWRVRTTLQPEEYALSRLPFEESSPNRIGSFRSKRFENSLSEDLTQTALFGLSEEATAPPFRSRKIALRFDGTELLFSSSPSPLPIYAQVTGAYLSREEYDQRRGAPTLETLWGRYDALSPSHSLAEWDSLGLGNYEPGKGVDLPTFERRVLLAGEEDRVLERFEKEVRDLSVRRPFKVRGLLGMGVVGYILWRILNRF
jgi:hypothetical protein